MSQEFSGQDSSSLKDFLVECEELIEAINSDLMKLSAGAADAKADPSLLNSIFRSAHTLKGISGMFGYEPMVRLSHNLEELLDGLRLGKVGFSATVLDILFEAISVIQMLLEAKGLGEEPPQGLVDSVSKQLSDTITSNVSSEDLSGLLHGVDSAILDVLTEYEEHRLIESIKEKLGVLKVQASFPIITFDQALEELSNILKEHGEIITTLPTPGATPGETINFDLIVASSSSIETLSTAIDNSDVLITLVAGVESAGQGSPTQAAEAEGEKTATISPQDDGLKSITQTVRVDIAKLDSLMNLVGELIITKGSIISIAANMKNQLEGAKFSLELQKPLKSLDKRLTALQEGLMEARMVPLTQIFDKLSRNVRKIGRDINKEVSLEVFGGDTKLDKLIVEELSGPLMHIIRNSMDHGIESAEVREGKGKPAKGVITLNAYQSGGHVLIEVSDDGGGINHEKIFKKAVEKGLVEPGHLPRKEEIINLMFLPGFSTSDEVSDISGRGVGMDVVKESIAAISGMVEIESKEGQGTKVILTLPMTLAIIQALIAEVNGRHFAVPLNTVVESFLLEDTQVETIETKEFVHLRNATIPIIRLSELLDLPENSTEKRDVRCFEKYVVVVGLAEKKLGLVVDDLLGQQDIVIKSVGKRLGSVSAIAGATEYRQKTILTIDVGGIIEECMGEQSGLKSTLSN